ncbi:MAG: hypothetical protein LBT00_00635 [Spirochaetaceae bacterium]|nr:hypothetical protein [Spirochaetaceae bacterium]
MEWNARFPKTRHYPLSIIHSRNAHPRRLDIIGGRHCLPPVIASVAKQSRVNALSV